MGKCYKTIVLTLAATVILGLPCLAQDVELPFTWEGNGQATLISQDGTNDIEFQFELSIDKDGMISGQTRNEDGASKIKHVFVSDINEYEVLHFFSRKVCIVLLLNEYGDNPLISILNGRLLADMFFYGEVLLTQYEEGSDKAKALGIGDPQVTLMMENELSQEVNAVLDQCLPVGTVKIVGDYKAETHSQLQAGKSLSLFNGQDLEGWYIYHNDPTVDPKEVWKVKEGEIWCSGAETGFLRTVNEYSDYKLTLEWRWPEEPGNSGVMLHMNDEEKVWPVSMEAQLMNQRAGDLIGMAADLQFDTHENKKSRYAPRMNESNEKKPGEWNTYEITCKGDTIELKINGLLQNKGTGIPIKKGYIGFQSEGAPIVLRNIVLTSLE